MRLMPEISPAINSAVPKRSKLAFATRPLSTSGAIDTIADAIISIHEINGEIGEFTRFSGRP